MLTFMLDKIIIISTHPPLNVLKQILVKQMPSALKLVKLLSLP